MRKWLVGIIALFGTVAVAPSAPAEATTVLGNSQAIMSTISGCGGANGWRATFHLYSTYDGGTMNIYTSNWVGGWQPGQGQSSEGLYTLVLDVSDQSASVTVSATLRIVRPGPLPGVVYRSAQRTAQRSNC